MTVIKIPLGFLLAIVFGLVGAGLVFAALFSRDTRFWLIDQDVGGTHDELVNDLIPPTAYEQFVLWTGAGVFGIAAVIAVVTAVSMVRSATATALPSTREEATRRVRRE